MSSNAVNSFSGCRVVASICSLLILATAPTALSQPAPQVRLVLPDGPVNLFINEHEAVAAEISFDGGATWRRGDPSNTRFVSWSVNDGSYVEQIMDQIIRDFPGTPMASIARKNVEYGFWQIPGNQ